MEKTNNESIRERIKTFEDAVEATGMALPFNEEQMAVLPKDVVAYAKLRIIAAALNGLTKDTLNKFPKFNSDYEIRHYPFFRLKKKELFDKANGGEILLYATYASFGPGAGFVTLSSRFSYSLPSSPFPSRLAVKTKEDAEYFGKQFISIWSDYLLCLE